MRAVTLKRRPPGLRIRTGDATDLDALIDLDECVFATDRMSRRSLRHFLNSPTSRIIVAERDGVIAGYALALFRPNSAIARLYSIAVAPDRCGIGIGPVLLAGVEDAARSRGCNRLRLEVHESNRRAIELYRKCGYSLFGHYRCYYHDQGDAYRFEKALAACEMRGPPEPHDSRVRRTRAPARPAATART